MAKYTLNNTEENFSFLLYGIVSDENIYRLISTLNHNMNLDLSLSDNLSYSLKPGSVFQFSLFKYLDEEFGLEFSVIPNNSNLENQKKEAADSTDLFSGTSVEERTKLIKELPKINYFLIVKGEDLHLYKFKILDKLKSNPAFLQVQNIEPQELNSRSNLVF